METFKSLAVTTVLLTCLTTPTRADTINTMQDVGRAIDACWQAPSGLKGSVTLSFSFKRDGSLIGRPRPTSISVEGNSTVRQKFVESAIDALSHCMPLTFSPGLAQGMAGQVFTMPFVAPKAPNSAPAVTTP